MHKSLKIILSILGIAVIWVALASINAGILGLGFILAIVALLDVVRGEFTANNKMVWLMIILAALLFALIGIASDFIVPSTAPGHNPIRTVSTVIVFMLPAAYFLIGIRQKVGNGDRRGR